MSVRSPLASPRVISPSASTPVKVCRRKSCTRLELEWSCGLPHPVEPVVPLELHRVTCEDMTSDVDGDLDGPVSGFVTTDTWSLLPDEPFDEAPYAVHSREIRRMWSEPDTTNVLVRGRSYQEDHIKVRENSGLIMAVRV